MFSYIFKKSLFLLIIYSTYITIYKVNIKEKKRREKYKKENKKKRERGREFKIQLIYNSEIFYILRGKSFTNNVVTKYKKITWKYVVFK